MNEKEEMQHAVNDMKLRLGEASGAVTKDFLSSRLDKISDPYEYNIPVIADLLFGNGTYERKEIVGLEVESDNEISRILVSSGTSSSLPILGYGARTFVRLKSPKRSVLGYARITFMYEHDPLRIIPLGPKQMAPQPETNNEFSREMDYLKIKFFHEAAVYRIDAFAITKTKPEVEHISELVDPKDESPSYLPNIYRELGADMSRVNKLLGTQSVIEYFKKLWSLDREF